MRRLAAGLVAATLVLTGCTSRPAPRPAAPALPGGRLDQPFGVKWNGYDYPPRYASAIAGYRGGGTFHDITWCAVEPNPGNLRWGAEDKVVNDALGYGLELLIRIHVGSCWVNGRPASDKPRLAASHPPADLGAYQVFVRRLVQRYAARGVHLYAIENEIDAENYWGESPSTYPPVGRAGAAAARAADPTARLVDSGLSSSSYGLAVATALLDTGRSADAVTFYRSFYARRGQSRLPAAPDPAGLRAAAATAVGVRILAAHAAVRELNRARVFDIYQLHYYDPWELAADVLDHIRRQIPATMPIEAWELGSFWPGQSYDAKRHAAETAKLVATLLSHGVRRAVYLPLFFSPGVIAPEERWRGLYGADGVARPVTVVFAELRDSTRAGSWQPVDRDGLAGAAVDRGGATTLIVWAPDGQTRSLPTPPALAATATALPGGAALPWRDALHVGSDPVVISTPTPLQTTLSWLG